jgi:hypothetical protein
MLSVAFELLGGFGGLVDLAYKCLVLALVLIVSVIIVIFGAARRARSMQC